MFNLNAYQFPCSWIWGCENNWSWTTPCISKLKYHFCFSGSNALCPLKPKPSHWKSNRHDKFTKLREKNVLSYSFPSQVLGFQKHFYIKPNRHWDTRTMKGRKAGYAGTSHQPRYFSFFCLWHFQGTLTAALIRLPTIQRGNKITGDMKQPTVIAPLYNKTERERLFQRSNLTRKPDQKFKFECEKQS